MATKVKYARINLMKYVWNLHTHTKNYDIKLREIKDVNKRGTVLNSKIGKVIL